MPVFNSPEDFKSAYELSNNANAQWLEYEKFKPSKDGIYSVTPKSKAILDISTNGYFRFQDGQFYDNNGVNVDSNIHLFLAVDVVPVD